MPAMFSTGDVSGKGCSVDRDGGGEGFSHSMGGGVLLDVKSGVKVWLMSNAQL